MLEFFYKKEGYSSIFGCPAVFTCAKLSDENIVIDVCSAYIPTDSHFKLWAGHRQFLAPRNLFSLMKIEIPTAKCTHPNVHRSAIPRGRDMDTTQVSLDRGLDKEAIVQRFTRLASRSEVHQGN